MPAFSEKNEGVNDNGVTATRKQLLARGYAIIPNINKECWTPGWNRADWRAAHLEPRRGRSAPERVERWDVEYPRYRATGVRVENGLIPIDIDIRDQAMVDRLLAWIQANLPDVYTRAPMRYGSSCKVMLFCQTNENVEAMPAATLPCHDFRDPGNPEHIQRVEIFTGKKTREGKCSRQVAVYGPHSHDDNGTILLNYAWDENVPELKDVDFADLPVISYAQMGAIIDAFEGLALAAGWEQVTKQRRAGDGAGAAVYDIDENTRFDTDRAGDNLTYAEVCAAYSEFGALRCSTSFMPGRDAKRRDHCQVSDDNRHGVVAVYVFGDGEIHFPVAERPIGDASETGFGEGLRGLFEATGTPVPGFESGARPDSVAIGDFYAYLPTHQYIYRHTGELWLIGGLNASLDPVVIGQKPKKQTKKQKDAGEPVEMVDATIPASLWLDRNKPVTQMSWAPGRPQLVPGRTMSDGGWSDVEGAVLFNTYRPPAAAPGDPARVLLWLDLLRRLYPDHVDHIVAYLAHRVQFPAEKINHALVLTGSPGIGKDTLLEPVKHAVGAWNFKEISPHDIGGNNNDYMMAVIVRVSEARDLGDTSRYDFYEKTKTVTAAPPDTVRINIKHVPQFYVPNCAGVIFTTNYSADGLYLPSDDRRHYVCGTVSTRADFTDSYFTDLWNWYGSGGLGDIAAYLAAYDLSAFNAKAPPAKTAAFWRMVDAGRPSEEPEFRDAMEQLGNPLAVTILRIASKASNDLAEWIRDRRNRRNIPRRMESCGYEPVRNAYAEDGYWKIGGRPQVIYGLRSLPLSERYAAAERLKKEEDAVYASNKGKLVPFKR